MLQVNPNRQHKFFEVDYKEIFNRNGSGSVPAGTFYSFVIPWAGFTNGAMYLDFFGAGVSTMNIFSRPFPASPALATPFPQTMSANKFIDTIFPTDVAVDGVNTNLIYINWNQMGNINFSAYTYAANQNAVEKTAPSSIIQPWTGAGASIQWTVSNTGAAQITFNTARVYLSS